MVRPSEYIAEETQGITRVEDLPKLIRRSRAPLSAVRTQCIQAANS